jgi:predicted Rossmann fold nucleotide-binding protein DprA/Smf involved in DNA uptake
MQTPDTSDDAKAVLLLCGNIEGKEAQPLSPTECSLLHEWLARNAMRPAHLLSAGLADIVDSGLFDGRRLAALLSRAPALPALLEKWRDNGIWVVSQSDAAYPRRLTDHLQRSAPPLLFGAGTRDALDAGGLAILGSRADDEEAAEFTTWAATRCAGERVQVISGGTRGIDDLALQTACENGGPAMAVLADNLLHAAASRRFRPFIEEGLLTLVSPDTPETAISLQRAGGRVRWFNGRCIYALTDYTLIVNADFQTGHIWTGATEELRRENHTPLFVRLHAGVPRGNLELAKLGAVPFPDESLRGGIMDSLAAAAAAPPPIDITAFADEDAASVPEPPEDYTTALPYMLEALENPITIEELTDTLNTERSRVVKWVKFAVQQGQVQKAGKPPRYQRKSDDQQELDFS